MRLTELASLRDSEMDELDHHTTTVIDHLIKIWLFPRYRSVSVWMKHVWKGINATRKIKKKGNKYLPSKDIYQTTWLDNKHILKSHVMSYIEDHEDGQYPGYMRDVDVRNLDPIESCMESYFKKLADELSTEGSVTPAQVREFIKDSGFIE